MRALDNRRGVEQVCVKTLHNTVYKYSIKPLIYVIIFILYDNLFICQPCVLEKLWAHLCTKALRFNLGLVGHVQEQGGGDSLL